MPAHDIHYRDHERPREEALRATACEAAAMVAPNVKLPRFTYRIVRTPRAGMIDRLEMIGVDRETGLERTLEYLDWASYWDWQDEVLEREQRS